MDNRFIVTKEWTGNIKPQHVFRFCGRWVKSYPTRVKALLGRNQYINERNLILEGKSV